jgi:hypothetical protein
MKLSAEDMKKNMKWHVPASIATLAMGIYLALVCFVPSFVPEYHEFVMTGKAFMLVPYGLLIMIGSPIFSLWHYTKLETDPAFREQYYED